MAEYSSVSLSPPKDWQAFERKSHTLYRLLLSDPNTQMNGRSGQEQHGVDIYGRRNGSGVLVGIQCKGKDGNYGGAVSDKELRAEVKKSEKFKPALDEFVLITTAPDDQKIQEAARLLELELKTKGRDLKITVLGWGQLQLDINRFPEALREFHPDATMFSDQILAGTQKVSQDAEQIKELLAEQDKKQSTTNEEHTRQLSAIQSMVCSMLVAETKQPSDALNKHINGQIDGYRDLINAGKSRTAIGLLEKLKKEAWNEATPRIKFRILANIAAAHHRLRDYELSADMFIEAYEFDKNDPAAAANKIAGLLIKKQNKEAWEFAKTAVQQFPDDPNVALQRLQARDSSESVNDLWAHLTPNQQSNPDLIVYRIVALREDVNREWVAKTAEAIKEHPDNLKLQLLNAEAALERVIGRDPSALGAASDELPTQTEILSAAEIFEKHWKQTSTLETPADEPAAHNAALAYAVVGRKKEAAKLLDDAFAPDFKAEETKRFRLLLYIDAGQRDEAIKLADTLSDSPKNRIFRADMRAKTAPMEAREILNNRETYSDKTDVIAAALSTIDCFLVEKNYTEALVEAQRLAKLMPDHPQSSLAIYHVKNENGDADAENYLDEALSKLKPTTDFPTRFMVANALGGSQRISDVVDVLNGYVATKYDAPALRTLIASAINADRRVTAGDLLASLPDDLKKMLYYEKAAAALALRVGDSQKAEEILRRNMALNPRSLESELQFLQILLRHEKTEELKKEVARSPKEFDGSPEQFMKFAQYKEAFGDWLEAYDLGYRTLLKEQSNSQVNLFYFGLLMRPGHTNELNISPGKVDVNMAVELKDEDNNAQTFVIEPDPTLRPSNKYLAPDHRLAKELMEKSIGDELIMPDGTKGTVSGIKPKELHALHELMRDFPYLFPEENALQRVRIGSGPDRHKAIFDKVRARADASDKIADVYSEGHLTIALAGALQGIDPIYTLQWLITAGKTIKVCDGLHPERNAALASIEKSAGKGCVIDAITLHVVLQLGVQDALVEIFGSVGITAGTVSQIQQDIHDLESRLGEMDNSLIWKDGQVYRQELAPEDKRQALEILKGDLEWIKKNATVLPAVGTSDPSPQLSQIMEKGGSEFLDDLLAAQSSGRIFCFRRHDSASIRGNRIWY